jgi:hypothetical protein
MGDFLRAHLLKIVIVVALIWAWKYWNDSHRYVANSNGGIYDSREGRYVSKTPVVEEEKTSATPKSPGAKGKNSRHQPVHFVYPCDWTQADIDKDLKTFVQPTIQKTLKREPRQALAVG